MSTQLGFYIDQSRCTGCHACAMACKDKNDLDAKRAFRKVTEYSDGSFAPVGKALQQSVRAWWVSLSCNHCEAPRCVEGCPTGAMHKDPQTGIVSVDQKLCVGCRYCMWNCPYSAPEYDATKGKMSKCDLCADLVAAGKEPACVAACPYELIKFGPIDELRATYGSLDTLKGLPNPELTRPNLVICPHRGAEA